ncbi:MAG: DUF4394 domain-containing protein [Solirubrobacteraceae bacterium]|nr:DUF4394 domain-containing protein [Solirubrobacteraceae bacterium]
MSNARRRILAATLFPIAAIAAAPSGASAATAFYGVTADNRLAEFQSDNTTQVPSKPLRGLAADERVVGLDVRPADWRLYAVTNKSRIVVINPRNGGVRYVGNDAINPALTGDRAAFDFNPTVDAIRLETNAGQNLRLDPATGQLVRRTVTAPAPTTPEATTPTTPAPTTPTTEPGQPDGALKYAPGDAGANTAPKVTAAAYTNTFPIGTSTELFVLDAARNALAKQNPPNEGTLTTVGGLGTTGEPIAFDIAEGNNGFAAIQRSPGSSNIGLYRVNLTSGAATPVGAAFVVGTSQPLVALAAAGDINDDTSDPNLSVSSSSTQLRSRLLAGGLQLTVNANEAVTGEARVRVAGRTIGTADVEIVGGAGFDRVVVPLNSTVRDALRAGRSVRLDLRVEVADGAGNRSDLSRPIRSR